MAPAVEVISLVVRYGSVTAVSDVSFTAAAGEVTAVIGPNGAGKTSTIETCEGYRVAASGAVRVLGLDPRAPALRPLIGVMLQSGGVYPGMTPGEAVRLFAAYYDNPIDPETILATVGLERVSGTPWRRLSGGEQQRLSLGLALVGRPQVAFLDEPTAGVDPAGRLVIRDVIRDLRERGVAVVLTTHELDEASRLADQVIIIDRGQVVAAGSPAELMGSGSGVLFSGPPGLDIAALGARIGCPVLETTPGEYEASAVFTPALVAAITAWFAELDVPIGDLRAGRQTLEDVFLRLVSRG